MLIREALQELAVWSSTATLKLVSHEEMGRSTMLIKDWKDQFLDLGDKQSLLASLRESPFYRAFEDVGASYEIKMSHLDFILHAHSGVPTGCSGFLGTTGEHACRFPKSLARIDEREWNLGIVD